MKKFLKGLLVAVLAVSSVGATTNKTFLMPRSQGVNLAMEYTTYNELIQHKNGDFFGAHFQVVPFYMESSDSDDIGKYFGINDKNIIKFDTATPDLSYLWIAHIQNPVATTATVKLDPELQAYGARIDYYQDLEKILDGLYLKISLPIIHVDNDMNVSDSNETGDLAVDAITSYLKGDAGITTLATANSLAALEYAKMGGSHSETSVADIDVVLGYKVLEEEDYYLALNLGLTIPVGNDPDGLWVFEPVVGNGGHWGLGGGLDGCYKIWEDGDSNIKLTAVANYRYLFESTEKRTLGLKKADGKRINWGQYRYLGKIGVNSNNQLLIPAANILTKDVDVEPGSQLDAIIYFTYNYGGWSFDLGYNFFYKCSEDVDLKDTALDNTDYYVAHNDFDTSTNQAAPEGQAYWASAASMTSVTPAAAVLQTAGTAFQIKKDHIDVAAAETDSSNTHKIFGSLGYIFKDWEYPVMLGLGGEYEFADDDGIEGWSIYGKLGIKF